MNASLVEPPSVIEPVSVIELVEITTARSER
jgi:hypothetical protein